MEPNMCVKGCGFFGSSENRDMCSKCYKDFVKTEEVISKKSSSSSSAEADVSELTVKKKRCKCCNKKVGPLGFRCRCGGLFCGHHRMPELHSCEVDYKTSLRSNPHLVLVKADKLHHRI